MPLYDTVFPSYVFTQRNGNKYPHKDFYTDVHSSLIYSSSNLETNQTSINTEWVNNFYLQQHGWISENITQSRHKWIYTIRLCFLFPFKNYFLAVVVFNYFLFLLFLWKFQKSQIGKEHKLWRVIGGYWLLMGTTEFAWVMETFHIAPIHT